MRQATKQDLKIAVLAWLSIAVMFGFIAILDWAGLDWQKWFGFALLTATVFGVGTYKLGESLKKRKCLLLFITMLVLHLVIWGYYLRSINGFSLRLFLVAPFEAGAMGAVLVGVGGARVFRRRAYGKRRHEADHDAKVP
ncbi:MAG: hypothetical protein LAO04_18280 [Acidobacteriia bacterium]|nr:hypothetical protein [Terriglobia bacterium]